MPPENIRASKHHVPPIHVALSSENYNHENNTNNQMRLEKHYRNQQQQPRQRQHVHFDEYERKTVEQQQQALEVSCERNPTQLFIFMNRQLWDSALSHLYLKPIEAHIWISSFFPDSNEYKWRNLPLHLACLHGPEPAPLHFIEALIHTYPGAAKCRNHEGNLPIHLACECMDMGPRLGLEVEGILVMLIKVFPDCLAMMDSMGRRPIDILEEKDVMTSNKGHAVGRGVSIIKYMKSQSRNMVEVENRQESDELVNDAAKPRRWPYNVEVPSSSKSDTKKEEIDLWDPSKSTSHSSSSGHAKKDRIELWDNSKSVSQSSSRDGTKIEKVEQWQNPKSSSQKNISEHALSFIENSFPFLPSNKLLLKNDDMDQSNHDSCREDEMDIRRPKRPNNIASPTSPFNSISNATPHNTNAFPSATEHLVPFHQLEVELTSIRNAHQSMSQLLAAKTQNENELQGRLKKLEAEHAQLKNDFVNLKDNHSETVAELEQKTKGLENSNYEVKVVKSKERAMSAELQLKLQLEGAQKNEITSLKNELEKERRARIAALEKLEVQMKICADYKERSKQNEQLLVENNELQLQLAEKRKQLQETKAKETTLLGLLWKMHSWEDLDENKELQLQLFQNIKLLEETKAKEVNTRSEIEKISNEKKQLQMRLAQRLEETKAKEFASRDENEKLMKEKNQLQVQLDQKNEQLQETKSKALKLKEQLSKRKALIRKVKENNVSETEALYAKNMALREVALKSIKAVSILQRKVQKKPPSSVCSEESLKLLLKDAQSGYSNKSYMMNASESLKLLHPIINDARNLQQDTIKRSKQLLQQSRDTMELIGQIFSIPQDNFVFEPTLQILEYTITSHVQVLETLDDMLQTKHECKSKLLSLLNQRPFREIKNILTPTQTGGDKIEALEMAIFLIREHSTKMVSITHKHMEKLKSLSKTVAGIPKVKSINLDSGKKDVQAHLNMVDEITNTLDIVLSFLLQDVTQMKLASHNIHLVCANKNLTKL